MNCDLFTSVDAEYEEKYAEAPQLCVSCCFNNCHFLTVAVYGGGEALVAADNSDNSTHCLT